ncbi:hypothetical protein Taro_034660 [Colocasia esculenta]|uniref:Uncharacterized protein n=1 Tax=Colocasia esculenta TaxID=4460 RepID=A0A843W891_COLES|nr:hypothetical protein [Colocasia esculenta]
MDPCPFVRLIIESLALKLPPVTSKPAGSGVHPSNSPCFCTLQLQNLSSSPTSSSAGSLKTVPLPLSSDSSTADAAAAALSPPSSSHVVFNLDPTVLQRVSGKPATLSVSVYSGRTGSTCGFSSGRLLGRVKVSVDLEAALVRPLMLQSGWVTVGKETVASGPLPRLHLVLRSEPEPRFVFQFEGEPECSPVVYQIHNGGGGGSLRQPAFSCKFSADRRSTTRSLSLDSRINNASGGSGASCWGAFGRQRGQLRREQQQRKGWTVTIHDLSGSPVAAASMVTPFVPSPGSDRVSRSNPGAWLILQPTGHASATSWKPWGRLEAWRERGPADALGYRFELVDDPTNGGGVTIAQSAISVRKGGEFCIDPRAVEEASARSPSPFVVRGFVMESTVEGQGKVSKPTVQVGVQHVRFMADAALFVALGAAIDLSMDACRLFSQKLRKELCQDHQDYSS